MARLGTVSPPRIFLLILAVSLGACEPDGADPGNSAILPTTTTAPTTTTFTLDPGWTDDAFRDVVAYCQAKEQFGSCATAIINLRDTYGCDAEAVYRILDDVARLDEEDREARVVELVDELHAEGACQLGITQ